LGARVSTYKVQGVINIQAAAYGLRVHVLTSLPRSRLGKYYFLKDYKCNKDFMFLDVG
jgi:hypothetical protein